MAVGELRQDLLAALGVAIGLGPGREPEPPDDRVQARSHGRVGDAELALDVLDVPPGANEGLEELELLGSQGVEPAEGERALQSRAAALALQAHDPERFGADRALRYHRIGHEQTLRGPQIVCQGNLNDM